MEVALGELKRTTAPATLAALWEVARPHPRTDLLVTALEDGADPVVLARLARAHGLSPMLWRALRLAGGAVAGERWAADLQAEAELRRHQALLLLPHAVKTAVRPLLDTGLEPVVFKGPAVAVRYPEPGLRPMVDIDVVLPAEDHRRAVDVLRRHGWEVLRHADRVHYDTVLRHPEVPGLPLELHQGLDVWYERTTGVRADVLWRRRIPIDCLGTEMFGLRPEDEVVALAAHAGKPFHCFGRLIWAVDLAVVCDPATATLDWDLVAHLAASWRSTTVVAVALAQASRLGADPPAELVEIEGSRIRRAALAPLLGIDWALDPNDDGVRNRVRYALADDWTRRLVLFAGAPAPAPLRKWPAAYTGHSWRALKRAWQLWRRPVDGRQVSDPA